jgi:toxin ParE1/3/4
MGRHKRFYLKPAARADLVGIWSYGAETWGMAQADSYARGLNRTFGTLAEMPRMGRAYTRATPPVRIHPVRQHLVIYTEDAEGITILRILGGAQDWSVILSALE